MAALAARLTARLRCGATWSVFSLLLGLSMALSGCVAVGLPFTFDAAYGAQAANFSTGELPRLDWLEDGESYLEWRDGAASRVIASSGEARPAYDSLAVAAALTRDVGIESAAAAAIARSPLAFSRDRNHVLFSREQRLMLYNVSADSATLLADGDAETREVTLSPDGQMVAFVRANDLHVLDTRTIETRRLTADGSDTRLNGVLDWVYQEELYGRGQWRGYWWAPDSARLAMLQLDVSRVPVYPLVDQTADPPTLSTQRYPRAGDPNPVPRLALIDIASANVRWIDLSKYAGVEILIAAVFWSTDGRLFFVVQDRASRWLDLNVDASGETVTLVHESPETSLEMAESPTFLDDGSFLWLSARDGWTHIYHIAPDGAAIGQLTRGQWSVTSILGVDSTRSEVCFAGTLDTAFETHAYRVPLAGGEPRRLTALGANHSVEMAPGCRYFIDTYSDIETPPKVRLCAADGSAIRVLSDAEPAALHDFAFSAPRLVRIPRPDGGWIHATIVRPPGWSPLGRSSVALEVYGAPGAPLVKNRWHAGDFKFMQLLAAEGYIACVIDPAVAGSGSARLAAQAYGRLGALELADVEYGLRWMGEHEGADLGRVAVMGHSYGGFLACYAATNSTMFAAAIAAAPVTDWRFYDSIYTERLMGLPSENARGYAGSSVVVGAARLHGRLLLAHGLADDNVHPHNSFVLGEALRRAGRAFEVIVYPGADHGFGRYEKEWRRAQLDFLRRTIGAGASHSR